VTPVQDSAADGPPRTSDGHYVIVNGRRWRAADPDIPEEAASVLRRELMSARRAVKAAMKANEADAERTARDRVQRVKVALGERGTPWWEQTSAERRKRWADVADRLG
jgi:uncharacterized protein